MNESFGLACGVCEDFFTAYFVMDGSEEALGLLAPDASILVDGAADYGRSGADKLFPLDRYGRKAYETLKSDLLEKEILPSVFVVEGTVELRTNGGEIANYLKVFAVLTMRESKSAIQMLDIHRVDRLGGLISNLLAFPPGIILLSYDSGNYATLYLNDTAANATGRSKKIFNPAAPETPFWLFADPDIPRVRENLNAARESHEVAELHCLLSDHYTHMRLTAVALGTYDTREILAVAMTQETAETELFSKFRSFVAMNPGCLVEVSINENGAFVTFWSEYFMREIPSAYAAGVPALFNDGLPCVHPEDHEAVRSAYGNIIGGADRACVDFRVRNQNNQYIWVNLELKLYRTKGSQRDYSGMISIIQDKMEVLETLSASKGEIDKIISELPAGIGVFRQSNGNVTPVYFNERMHRILGISKEHFLSSFNPLNPYGFISKDSFESVMATYLKNGRFKPFSTVCEVQKEDHTFVWVRIVCSTVMEDEEIMIYVVMYDVTHDIRLSQSEQWKGERYRLLSEASHISVFDYDPEEDALSVSINRPEADSYEVNIQHASESITGITQIHPDDMEICQRVMCKAIAGEVSGNFEIRLQISEQGYRWQKVFYKSVKNEYGKVFRVVGRIEDIQNEKDAERALVSRAKIVEQFMQAGIDHSFLILEFDIDTGERVAFENEVSPNWMAKLSFPETTSLLRNEAIHPEDRDQFDRLIEQCAARGNANVLPANASVELRLQPIFGNRSNYRWNLVSMTFARNEYNRHIHLCLNIADIDDQKQRERREWLRVNTDPQTGALNHVSFEHELETRLAARAAGGGAALARCVAMIGLNDSVNAEDSALAQLHDEIIPQAVRTIQAWMRPEDVLGRYGTDEFAILLYHAQNMEAMRDRLRILSAAFAISCERFPGFSVSIGFSVLDDSDTSVYRIMRKVSRALYWARIRGGSIIVSHSADVDLAIRRATTQDSVQTQAAQITARPEAPVQGSRIFVRTFGHFDVFVDGKAVLFRNAKAKELLALLVDRRGGFLKASDAISYLWEGEPIYEVTRARYRKAAMYLKDTLDAYDAGAMIEVVNGKRCVRLDAFRCDYYDCLNLSPSEANYSASSYMVEYSWAENTVAILEARKIEKEPS